MKTKILIGALALVALCANAGQGINTVQTFVEASAMTNALASTNNSTAGTPIQIPPGVDIGLFTQLTTTNNASSGLSNSVCGFNFSPDGNIYTTTLPLSITNVVGSNQTLTAYALVNRTNLAGVKFIRWDQFGTSQTNGVTASVTASWVQ